MRLALPRGALFDGCLSMLDRAGFDTAEPRSASRSLIFDLGDLTIVTMRPSDVPTYVEAGAADLGITGKDVLDEQGDRAVYELVDLGFGRCRMVLAAIAGDDSLERSAKRLGFMRIATKYRGTAERYFERTGRQAEVIEVKGSVELAPLVGLADGIVDLVDTGRTMRENGLEVDYVVYTDEGHGFARPVNRLDFYGRVDEFLGKYLGGRVEPWQEIKGSSASVR